MHTYYIFFVSKNRFNKNNSVITEMISIKPENFTIHTKFAFIYKDFLPIYKFCVFQENEF